MGFVSRLRNIAANVIRSPVYQASGPRENSSMDLNQVKMAVGGFSQPVWGPEISTIGNYSREGYTSKTFIIPKVAFGIQRDALIEDEDVQLAINDLSSQITGGSHYWKGTDDAITSYMEDFSKRIDFDWMDVELVKELLWYGNAVYKPRMGIAHINQKSDLMHIPISSFVRIWWDRNRIPYKYEFRGSEYQGYHNVGDVMHFKWNPIDANEFGQGFGVAMTIPRLFERITPDGSETKQLPSLIDLKLSTKMTMHLTERRYIPRNVYQAIDANEDERAQLTGDLRKLEEGEDFVFGNKVEVTELGSIQRAFDPTLFADLTQGAIFKALNNVRGKQAGESQHTYANAKTAALLDEIGLASFPLAVMRQLIDYLFKPWYEANPIYSPDYGGGIVAMDWEACEYELNFGEVEKKDMPTEEMIKLIELATTTGAIQDPLEIRDLFERAGLPLSKEYTEQLNDQYNDPMGQMAMQNLNIPQTDMGGGPVFNTVPADQAPRPYDDPSFSVANRDLMVNPRPTDAHLNFTYTKRPRTISRKPFR